MSFDGTGHARFYRSWITEYGRSTVLVWVRLDGSSGLHVPATTASGWDCHGDLAAGWKLTIDADPDPPTLTYSEHHEGDESSAVADWPTDGAWHQIAAVRDAEAMVLYLDGRLVATETTAIPPDADCRNHVTIGSGIQGEQTLEHGLVGAVADLVVLTRPMPPDEVSAVHSAKQPFGTPLTPGAQRDFDDLRVVESTDGLDPHTVPMEVVGPRPHSNSDLEDVLAYWPLDGDGTNAVAERTWIYVAGGSYAVDGPGTADLVRYDPIRARWEDAGTLPPTAARRGSVIEVVDGRLYVIGGRDPDDSLSTQVDVVVLPGADPGPCGTAGSCLAADLPSVCGAESDEPCGRANGAAAVHGGRIYYIGGESNQAQFGEASVLEYVRGRGIERRSPGNAGDDRPVAGSRGVHAGRPPPPFHGGRHR